MRRRRPILPRVGLSFAALSSTMTAALACKTCGQAHEPQPLGAGMAAYCTRCGAVLARHTPHGLDRTAAFALAALFLYIPANAFPVLELRLYGMTSDNTVWQGVTALWSAHQPFIAIIVFLASIAISLLKIIGLLFLVLTSKLRWTRFQLARTRLYRFIDAIGRWAMLDVFVLAVLVSLVKLQQLATIVPGPGIFAFACVVVLTLFASYSFDPQTIWDGEELTS